MSVDARLRQGMALIEGQLPQVDTFEEYAVLGDRVRRHERRRRALTLVAAVAAVTVGAAIVEAQFGQDRAAPPVIDAPPRSEWVLVSSRLVGTDYSTPVGNEWSERLDQQGPARYPYWASADPASRRFLVYADDATALAVMTPGQADPLARIPCRQDGTGCLGAALGPGPEELTMVSGDFQLVVAGHDGAPRGNLGPAGAGLLNGLAWDPDGNTLAVAHSDHSADSGSLTVRLRRPDSAQEPPLFEYSEAAPPWYDAEEHRYADSPGAFNSWWAPRLTDLQWAPDSTRLAFTVATTPEGGDDEARHLQWRLFLADQTSGEVEQIADLGRCTEPVVEGGRFGRTCEGKEPSLSWPPDGQSITVLADATLTTYDLTGKELSSEPSNLIGPIVWMTSK
jgi:hypothetical protein